MKYLTPRYEVSAVETEDILTSHHSLNERFAQSKNQ